MRPPKICDRSLNFCYSYRYDPLNRIIAATDNTNNYNVSNIGYDKNGNIQSLTRNGYQGSSTFTNMDILDYEYDNGNKLLKVADTGNDAHGFIDDAVNTADTTDDYSYDQNGNLLSDTNKGITSITYNHLNLPEQVNFGSDNIQYVYDATGVKLKKTLSTTGAETFYSNGYIYEGNTLQFFSHPEGYVTPDGQGGYDYVYSYTDHLGSVRLSYTDADGNGDIDPNSEVVSENNYYPGGLVHKGYNSVVSPNANSTAEKYKYQGQELEEELGKDTYAYQWRDYDPATLRFNKIDRFAEKYADASPYSYITNNPISFREVKGDSILVHFKDKDGNRLTSVPKAVQQMFQDEFGITVGYNAETSMLYLDGEYDSELSQSEDATGLLVDALTDTNTGKGADKHGTIIFGYNLDGIKNSSVEGGEWVKKAPPKYKNGVTQIDLADYDANGKYKSFNYNPALKPRAFNLARTFEHEYLGHQRLGIGGGGDGSGYSMGRVVESVNQFSRQRGLPERLNYYTNGFIFFGNTNYGSKGEQRRAVKEMVNRPSTNQMHVQRKRY